MVTGTSEATHARRVTPVMLGREAHAYGEARERVRRGLDASSAR